MHSREDSNTQPHNTNALRDTGGFALSNEALPKPSPISAVPFDHWGGEDLRRTIVSGICWRDGPPTTEHQRRLFETIDQDLAVCGLPAAHRPQLLVALQPVLEEALAAMSRQAAALGISDLPLIIGPAVVEAESQNPLPTTVVGNAWPLGRVWSVVGLRNHGPVLHLSSCLAATMVHEISHALGYVEVLVNVDGSFRLVKHGWSRFTYDDGSFRKLPAFRAFEEIAATLHELDYYSSHGGRSNDWQARCALRMSSLGAPKTRALGLLSEMVSLFNEANSKCTGMRGLGHATLDPSHDGCPILRVRLPDFETTIDGMPVVTATFTSLVAAMDRISELTYPDLPSSSARAHTRRAICRGQIVGAADELFASFRERFGPSFVEALGSLEPDPLGSYFAHSLCSVAQSQPSCLEDAVQLLAAWKHEYSIPMD